MFHFHSPLDTVLRGLLFASTEPRLPADRDAVVSGPRARTADNDQADHQDPE
jgi:hypothetical protein